MTAPKDLEKTIERISLELELMQFLSNFDQNNTRINTGITAKIIEKVWGCVFADCNPITGDFFSKLSSLPDNCGLNLQTEIWILAYQNLDAEFQATMLSNYLEDDEFWTLLPLLQHVHAKVEIEADFALRWFPLLFKKVEANRFGDYAVHALTAYTENHQEQAIVLLQRLGDQDFSDEMTVDLVAIVLGRLRATHSTAYLQKQLTILEAKYRDSAVGNQVASYLRSWRISLMYKKYPFSVLINILSTAFPYANERTEKVRIASALALHNSEEATQALNWLKDNVSTNVTPLENYYLLEILHFVCEQNSEAKLLRIASPIIRQIPPVDPAHLKIWMGIDRFLVGVLKSNESLFLEIIESLVEQDEDFFQSYNFPRLHKMLEKPAGRGLVRKLLLSESEFLFHAGSALYLQCGISIGSETPERVISPTTWHRLLELSSLINDGELVADFHTFIDILLIDTLDKPLLLKWQEKFFTQAINFPGHCLAAWKQLSFPSKEMRKAVEEAERYFQNLEAIKDSPARSFSHHLLEDASRRGYEKLRTEVGQRAHESSILSRFAKRHDLIYGGPQMASVRAEGEVSPPVEMTEFRTSMEIPRLLLIEPEYLILSKLQHGRGQR